MQLILRTTFADTWTIYDYQSSCWPEEFLAVEDLLSCHVPKFLILSMRYLCRLLLRCFVPMSARLSSLGT